MDVAFTGFSARHSGSQDQSNNVDLQDGTYSPRFLRRCCAEERLTLQRTVSRGRTGWEPVGHLPPGLLPTVPVSQSICQGSSAAWCTVGTQPPLLVGSLSQEARPQPQGQGLTPPPLTALSELRGQVCTSADFYHSLSGLARA